MRFRQSRKECQRPAGRATAVLRGVLDVGSRFYPLVGLVALGWFLVRVVPKPSRASYPCQRVAAPLALSFVLWFLGLGGLTVALRGAGRRLHGARHWLLGLCLLVAGLGAAWALPGTQEPSHAAVPPHPANQPLGIAQGLEPGRVVWAYAPVVTDWVGPDSGQLWYEHVDQKVADAMLSWTLRGYTGLNTDQAAWNAIFRHANQDERGYATGERVWVKINLTTSNAQGNQADDEYNLSESSSVTRDCISNSPQLLHALLDQLVSVVGVAQKDITIGDPTGLFVNYLYRPLYEDFPDVHYLDNRGTLGRTRADFSSTPFYWSIDDADSSTQDFLPRALAQATYVINFAVLKSHNGAGITVNAKNHYGSLLRCPTGYLRGAANLGSPAHGLNGYYNLHDRLPGDCCRGDEDWASRGYYRPVVDLMGHEDIGGKTLLYLVDGLFGGKDWNSRPSRWSLAPFGNDWPSSLFLSMDPVAIESVAFDFLSQQWPEHALMNDGVQDYLHEAALAHDPPSGTFYDPERDGSRMQSLGVHEHWNNPQDKQYSRNLGAGAGIALIQLSGPPNYRTFVPLGLNDR